MRHQKNCHSNTKNAERQSGFSCILPNQFGTQKGSQHLTVGSVCWRVQLHFKVRAHSCPRQSKSANIDQNVCKEKLSFNTSKTRRSGQSDMWKDKLFSVDFHVFAKKECNHAMQLMSTCGTLGSIGEGKCRVIEELMHH